MLAKRMSGAAAGCRLVGRRHKWLKRRSDPWGLDRQLELEERSAFTAPRRGKSTAVTVNNGPANRQPQTRALRLRRDERIEYVVEKLWIDAGSGVRHFNDNRPVTVTPGFHVHYAIALFDGVHGFNGVVDQVYDHLLQLPAVPQHLRKGGAKVDAGRNVVIAKFRTKNPQPSQGCFVNIEVFIRPRGFAEQGTQVVQYFINPLTVNYDVGQGRLGLGKVRRRVLEELERRCCVG